MAVRPAAAPGVRYGKWAGFFAGPSAWFAHQQAMSSLIYAACPPHAGEWVIAIGAICAMLAAAGLAVSCRARARSSEDTMSGRVDRFVATLSVAIAAMSLLAVVFASASGAILQCQR